MTNFFSLVGPQEVIEEVSVTNAEDLRVGRVQPSSTLIDAVDAPIGPEHILPVLSSITVACTTVKAIAELAKVILALLEKTKGSPHRSEIVVVAPATGREIIRVTESTSAAEIEHKLLNAS